MSVFRAISDFWVNYGPWIGVALVPTIITGLTISAKTAKAGPWVQKSWDLLKKVMDLLSVVTHKDKLGTFKLPLTTSKDKEEKVKDELDVTEKENV